jgi:hypothetical protein
LTPRKAQRTILVLEQALSPNPIPAVPELEPVPQTAAVQELEPALQTAAVPEPALQTAAVQEPGSAGHPMRVVPAATGSRRGNWACQQLRQRYFCCQASTSSALPWVGATLVVVPFAHCVAAVVKVLTRCAHDDVVWTPNDVTLIRGERSCRLRVIKSLADRVSAAGLYPQPDHAARPSHEIREINVLPTCVRLHAGGADGFCQRLIAGLKHVTAQTHYRDHNDVIQRESLSAAAAGRLGGGARNFVLRLMTAAPLWPPRN